MSGDHGHDHDHGHGHDHGDDDHEAAEHGIAETLWFDAWGPHLIALGIVFGLALFGAFLLSGGLDGAGLGTDPAGAATQPADPFDALPAAVLDLPLLAAADVDGELVGLDPAADEVGRFVDGGWERFRLPPAAVQPHVMAGPDGTLIAEYAHGGGDTLVLRPASDELRTALPDVDGRRTAAAGVVQSEQDLTLVIAASDEDTQLWSWGAAANEATVLSTIPASAGAVVSAAIHRRGGLIALTSPDGWSLRSLGPDYELEGSTVLAEGPDGSVTTQWLTVTADGVAWRLRAGEGAVRMERYDLLVPPVRRGLELEVPGVPDDASGVTLHPISASARYILVPLSFEVPGLADGDQPRSVHLTLARDAATGTWSRIETAGLLSVA